MLLNAFPGELLFSRLCRTLSVHGETLQQFTASLRLSPRVSFHPFLTEHLVEIADSCQESPEKLWLEQTLFPLWVWSMPRYDKELRRLDGPPARLLRFCQLTGNFEYQRMSLRFCPACAKEDADYYGVAFWHREHQIPGVSACYRHGCRLISKTVPPRPHIAFELYPDQFHDGLPCRESEISFASYASDVFRELLGHDKEGVSDDFSDMLAKKGYLNSAGHVRKEKLYPPMNDIVGGLWNTPFFPAPPNKARFLSDLINNHDNTFPSRKLLFQFCIKNLPKIPQKTPHITQHIFMESQQSKILQLYAANVSMSEISRRTGRSRCYIRGMIHKEIGTDFSNTRKLNPKMEKYVINMARKGFHRRYIANELALSIGTIEGVISANKGLVEWRKQCRYESFRRRSRFQILKWMKKNPQGNRKELKLARARYYYWLYFNDRKWFDVMLPLVCVKYSVRRVNWDERDIALARKIEMLSDKLDMVISLPRLDAAVNSKGAIIRYKDKLPRTMNVISQRFKLK